MRLDKLILRNFRNIANSEFEPDPHLSFLFGANGQGKTSFIEALGFLATLKSFRGSKSAEIMRWGSLNSEVICNFSGADEGQRDWKTELRLSLTRQDPLDQKPTKVASINGNPYKTSASYLSRRFGDYELGFHTIVFNPSDHDLVRTDPGIRRDYLDRVIGAEDIRYLKTLQKFQKVLQQRNALLKSLEYPSPDLLLGFTEPMSQYSAYIAYRRLEWIRRASLRVNDITRQVAPNQLPLRLIYFSGWIPFIENLSFNNNNLNSVHFTGQGPLPSLEILEQAFWKRLSDLGNLEWKVRHSLVGPHRDDWAFFFGDQVLKGHGSQGEVRSALLALKLSEIDLFREATGHRPIFLLDDFSSELDRDRRFFLLEFLSGTDLQTVVTTTDDPPRVGRHYRVQGGILRESENEHGAGAVE